MCSSSRDSEWPSLGTLAPSGAAIGHKWAGNDQRPKGKGVALTNGRSLKGGGRGLHGASHLGDLGEHDSVAGLYVNGHPEKQSAT